MTGRMQLPQPVESALARLVEDLVARRFSDIAADGRIGRLTSSELARAVDEYPGDLVTGPSDALTKVRVYPLDGEPDAWAIEIVLWTIQEGQSDLTLSVTARMEGVDASVEIEDLHVL